MLDDKILNILPKAEDLAVTPITTLCNIGLTRAKAFAIRTVSEALLDGTLDIITLQEATPANVDAMLTSLPGIGTWTSAYIRMRVLGDRDAFPSTDLGIIKALSRLDLDKKSLSRKTIEELAETWRPWRAYATLHLWNSLIENNKEVTKFSK